MTEYLYRAFGTVKWVTSGLDRTPEVTILVDALPILRRTPAGAWVEQPMTGKEKWVSTLGRKRYACPTEAEAIESLKHRNRWRRLHLQNATQKADVIRETLRHKFKVQRLINGMIQFEDE